MSWIYEGKVIDSFDDIPKKHQDAFGFVYNMVVSGRNKETGEPFSGEYIGQKRLGSKKKKYVSNKYIKENGTKGLSYTIGKGKRRYYMWDAKESNWHGYTGSSKKLNSDIEKGAQITKYILEFCPNKTILNFKEHKHILCTGAMEDARFYNDYTQIKVFKKNIIDNGEDKVLRAKKGK